MSTGCSFEVREIVVVIVVLPQNFELWPGTLCCVLGQDTLLTLYSIQRLVLAAVFGWLNFQ